MFPQHFHSQCILFVFPTISTPDNESMIDLIVMFRHLKALEVREKSHNTECISKMFNGNIFYLFSTKISNLVIHHPLIVTPIVS